MPEEEKYKLALFMLIRNSKVMPTGLRLGKSQKEINKMSYAAMEEVLSMIDFNKAQQFYEEGKV